MRATSASGPKCVPSFGEESACLVVLTVQDVRMPSGARMAELVQRRELGGAQRLSCPEGRPSGRKASRRVENRRKRIELRVRGTRLRVVASHLSSRIDTLASRSRERAPAIPDAPTP